jgi:aspartate/tyrosine/aromatic aminotransferase
VLNNPENYKEWLIELKKVAESIKNSRKMLREELERLETPGNWEHITNRSGMFSFTGLTLRQCEIMMKKHHIYVVNNGRIAISCVVESNYKRIA